MLVPAPRIDVGIPTGFGVPAGFPFGMVTRGLIQLRRKPCLFNTIHAKCCGCRTRARFGYKLIYSGEYAVRSSGRGGLIGARHRHDIRHRVRLRRECPTMRRVRARRVDIDTAGDPLAQALSRPGSLTVVEVAIFIDRHTGVIWSGWMRSVFTLTTLSTLCHHNTAHGLSISMPDEAMNFVPPGLRCAGAGPIAGWSEIAPCVIA